MQAMARSLWSLKPRNGIVHDPFLNRYSRASRVNIGYLDGVSEHL